MWQNVMTSICKVCESWYMILIYDTCCIRLKKDGNMAPYPSTWNQFMKGVSGPSVWRSKSHRNTSVNPLYPIELISCIWCLTFGFMIIQVLGICLSHYRLKRKQACVYEITNEFMMFIWNAYMIMASDVCWYMKYVHVYYLLYVGFPHWAVSSLLHSLVVLKYRYLLTDWLILKISSPSLLCIA